MKRSAAAAALGALGGKARARNLSPERRSEIAAAGGRAAASRRKWGKAKVAAMQRARLREG